MLSKPLMISRGQSFTYKINFPKSLYLTRKHVIFNWILIKLFFKLTFIWFTLLSIGEPVQCTAWLGQCILYILIVMFEKVLMMLVLLIPQWKKVKNMLPILYSTPLSRISCLFKMRQVQFLENVSLLVSGQSRNVFWFYNNYVIDHHKMVHSCL